MPRIVVVCKRKHSETGCIFSALSCRRPMPQGRRKCMVRRQREANAMAQSPTQQQPGGPVTSGGRAAAHPDAQQAETGANYVQPGGVHRPAPVHGVEDAGSASHTDQSKGGLNRPHTPGEKTQG
jgi:hypothetical protein